MDDATKKLKIRKLLCISVDNVSANDIMIEWSRQNTVTKDPILKTFYMHVQCVVYIVNLIVKDGLKEVDQSIFKI